MALVPMSMIDGRVEKGGFSAAVLSPGLHVGVSRWKHGLGLGSKLELNPKP